MPARAADHDPPLCLFFPACSAYSEGRHYQFCQHSLCILSFLGCRMFFREQYTHGLEPLSSFIKLHNPLTAFEIALIISDADNIGKHANGLKILDASGIDE